MTPTPLSLPFRVSFVIPAWNEAAHIAGALEALQSQDTGGLAVEAEIIVVDDGSTDGTAEAAAAASTPAEGAPPPRFPVRVLRVAVNQGRIRARRAGVLAARHELVFLTDARCRACPDLLVRLATAGLEPLQGIALGRHELGGVDRAFHLLRRRIYRVPAEPTAFTPENFDELPKGTGMLLVRRDRFLQHTCEDHDRYANDDTGMLRAMINDCTVWLDPRVRVTHRETAGLRHVAHRQFRRGATYASHYLAPGGSRRRAFLGVLAAAVLLTAALAAVPGLGLPLMGLGAVACTAALLRMAQRPSDLPLLVFWGLWATPPFVAGILRERIGAFAATRAGRVLLRWGGVAAALALLASMLSGSTLMRLAVAVNPWWIAVALVPAAGMVLSTAWFHARAMRALGLDLPARSWIALGVAASAGNLLMPWRGGSVVRAAYLARVYAFPVTRFAAILAAAQVLNVAVVSAAGLAAVALVAGPGRTALLVLHVAGLAAAAGAVGLGCWWGGAEDEPVEGSSALSRIVSGCARLAADRGALYAGLGVLAANLVLDLALLSLGYLAVGVSLSWAALVLVSTTSTLAFLLPVAPSGLGVREAAAGLAAGALGTGPEAAVLAALLARVATSLATLPLLPWAWGALARDWSARRGIVQAGAAGAQVNVPAGVAAEAQVRAAS